MLCVVSAALGYGTAAWVIARFSTFSIEFPIFGAYSFGLNLRLDSTVLALTIGDKRRRQLRRRHGGIGTWIEIFRSQPVGDRSGSRTLASGSRNPNARAALKVVVAGSPPVWVNWS